MLVTYITHPINLERTPSAEFEVSATRLADKELIKCLRRSLWIFRALSDADIVADSFGWASCPAGTDFEQDPNNFQAHAQLCLTRRLWLEELVLRYQSHHERIIYRDHQAIIVPRIYAEQLISVPTQPKSIYRDGIKRYRIGSELVQREQLLINDTGEWLVSLEHCLDPGTWAWLGYLDALKSYINAANRVAGTRRIKTKLAQLKGPNQFQLPWWISSWDLVQNHQNLLLAKHNTWYEHQFKLGRNELDYLIPSVKVIFCPAGGPKLKSTTETALVECIRRSRKAHRKRSDVLPTSISAALTITS